jgi:hypothetical protein
MAPLIILLHPQTNDQGIHGWRCAVHHAWESEINDYPLQGCINAVWCDTRDKADAVGQLILYSCWHLFDLLGLSVERVALERDTDITAILGELAPTDTISGLVILGVMQ